MSFHLKSHFVLRMAFCTLYLAHLKVALLLNLHVALLRVALNHGLSLAQDLARHVGMHSSS